MLPPRPWLSFCQSVTGASHKRKDLPNQDRVNSCIAHCSKPIYIVAVADGHGSPECSRSDEGARIAVECALSVMQRFFENMDKQIDRLSSEDYGLLVDRLTRTLKREVASEIFESWRAQVKEHFRTHPLQEPTTDSNVLLRYGTTLNLAAVTEGLTVALKVGDGNILQVYRDGSVDEPLSAEATQIGDETESLCQTNVLETVRVKVSRLSDKLNEDLTMILVCSDGFTNAFDSVESFQKAASDFANMASTVEGRQMLSQSLEGWLEEYSEYSGDDVSLGILAAES